MAAQFVRVALLAAALVLTVDQAGRQVCAQVGTIPAAVWDEMQRLTSNPKSAQPGNTNQGSVGPLEPHQPIQHATVLHQRQQQLEQLQKLQDLQRQQLLLRQQELAIRQQLQEQQPKPPPLPPPPATLQQHVLLQPQKQHQILLLQEPPVQQQSQQPLPTQQHQQILLQLPKSTQQHQPQLQPRLIVTPQKLLTTDGGVVDFIPQEHKAAVAAAAKSQASSQQVRLLPVKPALASPFVGQQAGAMSPANQQPAAMSAANQQPGAMLAANQQPGAMLAANQQPRGLPAAIQNSPLQPIIIRDPAALRELISGGSQHGRPPAIIIIQPPVNSSSALQHPLPLPPPPPPDTHRHPPPVLALPPFPPSSVQDPPPTVNKQQPQVHQSIHQTPSLPDLSHPLPTVPQLIQQFSGTKPSAPPLQPTLQVLHQDPPALMPRVIFVQVPSSRVLDQPSQTSKSVHQVPESIQTKYAAPQPLEIVHLSRGSNVHPGFLQLSQGSKQPMYIPQMVRGQPPPPVIIEQGHPPQITSELSSPFQAGVPLPPSLIQMTQQTAYITPFRHGSPAASPTRGSGGPLDSLLTSHAQPATFMLRDPGTPNLNMDATSENTKPANRPASLPPQPPFSKLAPLMMDMARWEHQRPPPPATFTGWEHHTPAQSPNHHSASMAPSPGQYHPSMMQNPSLHSSSMIPSSSHHFGRSHGPPVVEMVLPPQIHSTTMKLARDMGMLPYYEAHGCVDPTMYLPPGSKSIGLALGCSSPQSEQLCHQIGTTLSGVSGQSQSLMTLMTPPSMRHLLETCLSSTVMKKMMMGMVKGGGGGLDPMTMMMMMGGGNGGGGTGGMMAAMAMMSMMKGKGKSVAGSGTGSGTGSGSGSGSASASPNTQPSGITDAQPLDATSSPSATEGPGQGQEPPPDPLAQCRQVLPMVMMRAEGGLITPEGAETIADTRRQLMPYRCQEMKAGLVPFRMCCPGHVPAPSFMDLAMAPSAA